MTILYLDDPAPTLTPHETFLAIVLGLCILVFYILKDTPLGFLWRWTKLFFLVLLATLFADIIKDKIKEWWNK